MVSGEYGERICRGVGKGTHHDTLLGDVPKHSAVECLAVSGEPVAPVVAMCCGGDCFVLRSSRLRSTQCQNKNLLLGKMPDTWLDCASFAWQQWGRWLRRIDSCSCTVRSWHVMVGAWSGRSSPTRERQSCARKMTAHAVSAEPCGLYPLSVNHHGDG